MKFKMSKSEKFFASFSQKFVTIILVAIITSSSFMFTSCKDDEKTDSFIGTVWTYHTDSQGFIVIPDYSYTDMQFYAEGIVWFGNADLTGEKPSISNARAFSYTYSGTKISITVNLKEYSGTVNGNQMKLYLEDDPATEILLSLKWKPKN